LDLEKNLSMRNTLLITVIVSILSVAGLWLIGAGIASLPAPEASETPGIQASPTPLPEGMIEVPVVSITDGDTFRIELNEEVRIVRLIGMDTPELRPLECFGNEALAELERLIENQQVVLEKDVRNTDRYGRLLRYVYVGDIFVNKHLVLEGFASTASFPPDIKYQEQLIEAEREARENGRGLWTACR
jgi:micrococcal nuclease